MADGTFTSFAKRDISIESEMIPISRSETKIYNKFALLHVKTNTGIFFISEWLQQRLMQFCQKGKSKDATAASGHLLCKFLQTIYTCMSERNPQNAGCGVDIMKNQEFIQAKLIFTSLFGCKLFHWDYPKL